jgi:hypothetical protein
MNPKGDALLGWVQNAAGPDDAASAAATWAAFRAATSTTWSAAFALSSPSGGRARPPAVGIDPSGNGHVAWVEVDAAGNARVVAARLRRESGQFEEGLVISGETPVSPALTRGPQSGNDNCRLAVDAQGRALALWAGPEGGIWAARFE